ncbi:Putative DNA-binding protein in cluster with Type I restriction-modification system [uncultured Candidatus Thioglobus sp.]|nr:Putative DNA-binding protein in cluster with Type I restriction-modification system [uncultured Candidatus Thioglobus sp.]
MSKVLLYKTENQEVRLEVLIQNETIWLNQKQICELFGRDKSVISRHIKNIFKDNELDINLVVAKNATTATDGKNYIVEYYNLDMIISVGYRVNSHQATQFRIWATKILQEYIIKGFAMDDERLKNPNQPFGKDYFDEQLERIRDVRSSERRFYQKITDIYAQCSADYDASSEETKNFYATVQNKLHFAMVGQTAAEIIHKRVDSKKQNIGLTSWKNAPKGKIRKADVFIAKNYLKLDELDLYNRIVTMYLDFAELQAKNKNILYQKDWIEKLHKFLMLNEREILQDNGSITAKLAKELAENEFNKYKNIQDEQYLSDFDALILALEKK